MTMASTSLEAEISWKAFGHVPPAFGKLRRAEGDVHTIGILKDCVVIAVDVAIICRAAEPAAGGGSLQRMRLENPVANVDDVNVLLDDDVARERAVVQPVAEPPLGGRSIGPRGAIDVSAEVVGFAADNLAKRPRVDAAD